MSCSGGKGLGEAPHSVPSFGQTSRDPWRDRRTLKSCVGNALPIITQRSRTGPASDSECPLGDPPRVKLSLDSGDTLGPPDSLRERGLRGGSPEGWELSIMSASFKEWLGVHMPGWC